MVFCPQRRKASKIKPSPDWLANNGRVQVVVQCTFLDNIYTTFTISVVTSERSSKWPQFFSILKILRIWWCCGFKGYCISGKPSLMMIFSFETCRPWPNSDKVATQYMFHLAELAMSCLCLSQKKSYLLLVRIGNRMARLAQLAISLCGWFPLALARHQPSRRGKTLVKHWSKMVLTALYVMRNLCCCYDQADF